MGKQTNMPPKKKSKLDAELSAEIKNLKQRIMLQNNDNIDLSSDLAEAEEKIKVMQQDHSLKLKSLTNLVSEKDQEIQSLQKCVENLEKQIDDTNRNQVNNNLEDEDKDNETMKDILDIIADLEEELNSVRNLVIVRKEEDDKGKKILKLKTILEDTVPYSEYQQLKKEKAELEAKVFKLTIQKMDLKRRNHVLGKLLTKDVKEEHEKKFKFKTEFLF